MIDYANKLGAMIKSVAEELPNNVFSPACFHHCTSEEPYYWNLTTHDGVSFSDATRILLGYKNETNKWVGDCTEGINCGSGCNNINDPW